MAFLPRRDRCCCSDGGARPGSHPWRAVPFVCREAFEQELSCGGLAADRRGRQAGEVGGGTAIDQSWVGDRELYGGLEKRVRDFGARVVGAAVTHSPRSVRRPSGDQRTSAAAHSSGKSGAVANAAEIDRAFRDPRARSRGRWAARCQWDLE
jgi:hypothetical protein